MLKKWNYWNQDPLQDMRAETKNDMSKFSTEYCLLISAAKQI